MAEFGAEGLGVAVSEVVLNVTGPLGQAPSGHIQSGKDEARSWWRPTTALDATPKTAKRK